MHWYAADMPARKRSDGPVSQRVAANIRRIRRDAEVTTYQLAAKLTGSGLSLDASAITRIENLGRSVNPDELVAFAAVLGTTPEDLLAEPFSGNPDPKLNELRQAVIDALADGANVSDVRTATREALALAASVTAAGVSLENIRLVDGEN